MKLNNFSRLFDRYGGYSLPVLVELKSPSMQSWYFTNETQNIDFGGRTYKATAMSYKHPSSKDGIPSGGTLEIIIDENTSRMELLKWFDLADDKAELEAIAVINEKGNITEVGQSRHRFGTVNWDGEKITWNLGEDDRLQMQINPWVFDPDALIG